MQIASGPAVRIDDRRTTSALLALCGFIVIACLPVAIGWTMLGGGEAPGAPVMRPSLPSQASGATDLSWRPVAGRHSGFDIDAPRWRPLGMEMTAYRRGDGRSREVFQFGSATDSRRHAAMVIERGPMDAASPLASLTGIVADLGIPAGLVGNPLPLLTKFGAMATADMTIEMDEAPKACLAFTQRDVDAGLSISGWVCNAGPELVSRLEAACFVDRLVAIGVRDQAMSALFAKAELARQPCPTGTSPATPPAAAAERTERPVPLRLNRL